MDRILYGPPADTLLILLDDLEDHDFENAASLLGAIDAEAAHRRVAPGTRTVAEITAHLVHNNEFNLAVIAGTAPRYTFPETWSEVDTVPWPTLRDRFLATLAELKTLVRQEDLNRIVFPADGDEPAWTVGYKIAASVAKHQAYHMGQIALLRAIIEA
jgi:uncharacterized damage-inducible protein DinB